MTEQNTSGAVVALPSIGDSAVLAEILMYTGRDAIAVMLNEQGDPNDFSRIVFGRRLDLHGAHRLARASRGWDPAARGAALRPLLSDMLENMPEEDRRTFADDESLLVLAVMTCFQEAAAIAEYWADAHETTDMQTILNGVLHDELFSAHFATWAEMILGIAPEEEDEEGAADDSEGDKTE